MPKVETEKTKGNSIELRISMWENEREIRLNFPREWNIIEYRMSGHDFIPLSDLQIQEAFEKPIGTPRIRDLARGKRKVVIISDDLARPTPVYKIAPFILKELEESGISEDKIRFVCATGCHRPLTRDEMINKLGRHIVMNYPVFNHNVYEHHVNMGMTSRGTPVLINREVAGCDLKIGVGCIVPHFTAGFGGGAKILLPGVSSMDTIEHNHVKIFRAHPEQIKLGKVNHNPLRLDMEEAARIAGLDTVVDVVLNHRREILGIFAGDFVEGHRKGAIFANKVYGTENKEKFNLMVINSFPIEESPRKALWPAKEALNNGGDAVLIWKNVVGRIPHYLLSSFGSDYGGRRWEKTGPFVLPRAKRLFIYSESLSKEEQKYFGPKDKVLWYQNWDELIDILRRDHPEGTSVAVYPYSTIQCPVFPDEYL